MHLVYYNEMVIITMDPFIYRPLADMYHCMLNVGSHNYTFMKQRACKGDLMFVNYYCNVWSL